MADEARADGRGGAGHDDFAGIRSYQSTRCAAWRWRQITRLDLDDGGQLVTEHFEGGAVDELVLDFKAMTPMMHLELRLPRWVLEAEQRALQWPGLRALALHGAAPEPEPA